MPSGYSATLPDEICPDAGTLLRDVSTTPTALGVTRGGLKFTPDVQYRNVDFDGKRSEIEGLDRITFRRGKITGKFIQIGTPQVAVYEPGSTSSGTGTITVVPHPASTTLPASAYLSNLTLAFNRGDGGTVEIVFAKALCTKYEMTSQDNNEVEVDCEFEARLGATAAATSTDASPYAIDVTAGA